MRNTLLVLVMIFSLSACGGKPSQVVPTATSTEQPVSTTEILPTVTPVCISSEAAQADIDRALSFPGDIFAAPDWARTYTVADARVSVVWSNAPLRALAYVEALVFPCGYEEPDLDNYYIDGTWKVIFSNYDSYEPVVACKMPDGVRLYEFKVVTAGADYAIRYWAKNDTDHRVIGTMLVFPAESQPLMDEYAAKLYANFTACT